MQDIEDVFPRHACDWCAGVLARRGAWINSTLVRQPGSRDPECAMCYLPLKEGENLVRHNDCHHVFHTACVDGWVNQCLVADQPEQFVTCGMCRQPMVQIEFPGAVTTLQVVDDIPAANPILLGALSASLGWYRSIHPVPKSILEALIHRVEVHALTDADDIVYYRDQNLRRQADGEFPVHQTMQPPSNSIIFQSSNKIYAGALRFKYCPHTNFLILLSPVAYFVWCETLYTSGWDPVTGSGTRLRLTDLPMVMTLDRVLVSMTNIMQQRGIGKMEISAADITNLYCDHQIVRVGKKLLIRLTFDPANDQAFKAGICAYQVANDDNVPRDWVAPESAGSDLRIFLGPARALGFGDAHSFLTLLLASTGSIMPNNITVVPLDDDPAVVQHEANLHHTKYYDVNAPPMEQGDHLDG